MAEPGFRSAGRRCPDPIIRSTRDPAEADPGGRCDRRQINERHNHCFSGFTRSGTSQRSRATRCAIYKSAHWKSADRYRGYGSGTEAGDGLARKCASTGLARRRSSWNRSKSRRNARAPAGDRKSSWQCAAGKRIEGYRFRCGCRIHTRRSRSTETPDTVARRVPDGQRAA